MNPSPSQLDLRERIQGCQRFLRLMTGIILGAIALIILMTTFSTGPAVRVGGKALYYLVVLAAFASLGVWLYRVLIERNQQKMRN
ncbi:MAG: hypothetical protein FJY95_13080 [Candidatus Handelsmanbacteria bacterium]|nr:hypothetical protein [Candidatus Handelsmanbacteria bacterium]